MDALPIELQHLIIDCWHHNPRALSACSLVCRSWCSRSRQHLLQSIKLNQGLQGRRLGDFLSFLQDLEGWDSSSSFTLYVHELRILGDSDTSLLITMLTSNRPMILMHALDEVLSRLPQLLHLQLAGLQLEGCTCLRHLHIAYPQTIETVDMSMIGTPFSSLDDFLSVLSLFGAVEELRLSDVKFSADFRDQLTVETAVSRIQIPAHVRVRNLVVETRGKGSNFMCELFRRTQTISALCSLDVSCRTWDDITSLGALIRASRSTLTHFTLNISRVCSDEGRIAAQKWGELNLSACTSLQTIVLPMDIVTGTRRAHMTIRERFSSLVDLISFLPMPEVVRDVSFNFPDYFDEDEFLREHAQSLEWERMQTVLHNLSLKSVVFRFIMHSRRRFNAIDKFRKLIKTKLPRLVDEKLVWLRFHDDA